MTTSQVLASLAAAPIVAGPGNRRQPQLSLEARHELTVRALSQTEAELVAEQMRVDALEAHVARLERRLGVTEGREFRNMPR